MFGYVTKLLLHQKQINTYMQKNVPGRVHSVIVLQLNF